MPSLGTVTLPGKSGKPYKFRVYPLGTVFKKGFAAVYVLTQRAPGRSSGMRHRPLLLGQSPDLRKPDKQVAPTASAANCVCVHREPDEQTRQAIKDDLSETCRQGRSQGPN